MNSILPYFLSLFAATALFATNVWRGIDDDVSGGVRRVSTLDGLRGYLALSVMLQHAMVARSWLVTGSWSLPHDPFYAQLGSVAVSLFFMITGYLFWDKLVSQQGRMNWMAFYIGRVFRIGPIYWVASAGLVFIVFWRTGFELHEPAAVVAGSVLRWLGLGFLPGKDFNGYENAWVILAGVVWTLKYEWKFYFALLPASLFAKRRLHLPAAIVFLAIAIVCANAGGSDSWSFWTLFGAGMLTASLKQSGVRIKLPDSVASAAVLVLLAALLFAYPPLYSSAQALPLAVVFFLICNGTTLFGLLTSTPAVRLGHASYGIYLLQGFVFAIGFDNALVRPLVTGHIGTFWLVTIAGALALCTISGYLYMAIERPMIQYGRRLASSTAARMTTWWNKLVSQRSGERPDAA